LRHGSVTVRHGASRSVTVRHALAIPPVALCGLFLAVFFRCQEPVFCVVDKRPAAVDLLDATAVAVRRARVRVRRHELVERGAARINRHPRRVCQARNTGHDLAMLVSHRQHRQPDDAGIAVFQPNG